MFLKKVIVVLLIIFIMINIAFASADLRDKIYRKKNNFGLILGYEAKEPLYNLSVYAISKHGYGFEFSFASNLEGKEGNRNFYYEITESSAEDAYASDKILEETAKNLYIFNMIFEITSNFYIYGGPGLGTGTRYIKYYDPTQILGNRGKYWILADQETSSWFLMDGGIKFILFDNIILEAGYFSKPSSFMFGAGINIPR